ncbi:CAP domain-containing protein [Lutibacter sp.]|uniref:CAP domain-containing protein n=1 Tax=Lutibacter sp. TaxID=1925666 RepID=UPI002736C670|nr:CAP domain-containing protein [Lutibacter sp.]MDP3313428.1 CAP domain-containing protein [Lutibacter sp.]
MKPLTVTILSFILISSFMVSCSKEDDEIYFSKANEVVVEKNSYSPLETEILNLINNHRKTLNLSTLNTLNFVSGVANGHTNYMISKGEVNHDNFSQRSQTLITMTNAKNVGENVAFGYNSAQGVVNGWLNSSSHKSIIENPSFTHFGISTESDGQGRNYFTHLFISK